jgi:hypothetical protein
MDIFVLLGALPVRAARSRIDEPAAEGAIDEITADDVLVITVSCPGQELSLELHSTLQASMLNAAVPEAVALYCAAVRLRDPMLTTVKSADWFFRFPWP